MKNQSSLKLKKIIAVVVGVLLITATFFCGFFVRDCINGSDINSNNEILRYLEEYGVFNTDTLELERFSVSEITRSFVENLNDDYAHYYTKEEYQKIKDNAEGEYDGVGISVFKDTFRVYKVAINSPAYHSGILVNDILKGGLYNGNVKTFVNENDFDDFLKGIPKNVEFTLMIERDGISQSIKLSKQDFILTYVYYQDSEKALAFLGEDGDIDLTQTQKRVEEISTDTAYVSLYQFEGDCADQLEEVLEYAVENGKTKLIFDLRYNGGGYMTALEDVASILINVRENSSSVITYSMNAKGEYTPYTASKNGYVSGFSKVSVIANEYTASASECLIGAMLYYKNGFDQSSLIIENSSLNNGKAKTYGKGIMQTTFPLSDGGALKLTTAIIYQPDKATCIHKSGITVSGQNALLRQDGNAVLRAQQVLS